MTLSYNYGSDGTPGSRADRGSTPATRGHAQDKPPLRTARRPTAPHGAGALAARPGQRRRTGRRRELVLRGALEARVTLSAGCARRLRPRALMAHSAQAAGTPLRGEQSSGSPCASPRQRCRWVAGPGRPCGSSPQSSWGARGVRLSRTARLPTGLLAFAVSPRGEQAGRSEAPLRVCLCSCQDRPPRQKCPRRRLLRLRRASAS